MRTLLRNKRTIAYALYVGITDITDSEGYYTGEKAVTYADADYMSAYVSAESGTAEAEVFGTDLKYDRVIISDDLNCPVDENTILCVDKTPLIVDGKLTNHDYIVTKVAKGLDHISFAITKVDVE